MIPLRWIFRSRWAALAWGTGICLTAVNVAGVTKHGGDTGNVDAATSADGLKAVANALNAEDPE